MTATTYRPGSNFIFVRALGWLLVLSWLTGLPGCSALLLVVILIGFTTSLWFSEVRLARIRVTRSETGVTVRNVFRTYVLPWDDIDQFERVGAFAVGVRRKNGHTIKMMGVPSDWFGKPDRQNAVLAELASDLAAHRQQALSAAQA